MLGTFIRHMFGGLVHFRHLNAFGDKLNLPLGKIK
jgi:hypothetical protein